MTPEPSSIIDDGTLSGGPVFDVVHDMEALVAAAAASAETEISAELPDEMPEPGLVTPQPPADFSEPDGAEDDLADDRSGNSVLIGLHDGPAGVDTQALLRELASIGRGEPKRPQ